MRSHLAREGVAVERCVALPKSRRRTSEKEGRRSSVPSGGRGTCSERSNRLLSGGRPAKSIELFRKAAVFDKGDEVIDLGD